MVKYKVTQSFPNYSLGTIVSADDVVEPFRHDDFFELIREPFTMITNDGIEVVEGDFIYHVDQMFSVGQKRLKEFFKDKNIFIDKDIANTFVENNLDFLTEDGVKLLGIHDVYGVCDKGDWSIKTMTTLQLHRSSTGYKAWKWFSTERLREEYIYWNRPMISRQMVKDNITI